MPECAGDGGVCGATAGGWIAISCLRPESGGDAGDKGRRGPENEGDMDDLSETVRTPEARRPRTRDSSRIAPVCGCGCRPTKLRLSRGVWVGLTDWQSSDPVASRLIGGDSDAM